MASSLQQYFAAANGFSGFRSYFKTIFRSSAFEKIYVLKGGPGTGKHTLMRNVEKAIAKPNVAIEEYYCSSDPASLDGIIFESKGKRVGIVDGTAPHERDAVVPGAIDTIINLGESFSEDILQKDRTSILHIGDRKSVAYRQGYLYLSIAEQLSIQKKPLPSHVLDEYKEIIKVLIEDQEQKGANELKIKTAFCHLGFVTLPFSKPMKRTVKIDADLTSGYAFMHLLFQEMQKKKIPFIRFISPLSEDRIDSIYLPNGNIVITRAKDEPKSEERKIVTLPCNPSATENMIYEDCESECLKKAQESFSEASRAHFELEEIYKKAMNYKRNEALIQKLSASIAEILLTP